MVKGGSNKSFNVPKKAIWIHIISKIPPPHTPSPGSVALLPRFGPTLTNPGYTTVTTGVNPGGMGGGGYPPPPHFFGWGDGLYKHPPPPLFEDKIILNLTFIVKKLTFLTVKLLKTPKIARSLRSLAHKCILRLDLCGFASTFFS